MRTVNRVFTALILLGLCTGSARPSGAEDGCTQFTAVGVPVQLTFHSANDVEPSWSPDGTMIAFASYRTGNQEIYVVDITTFADVPVTSNGNRNWHPDWSPDGQLISYTGGPSSDQIWVIAPDGSGETAITTSGPHRHPDWSPDGSEFAYTARIGVAGPVHRMNLDGSGTPSTIISSGWYADWSPDGSRIAFARFAGASQIYLVDPDGSNLKNISTSGNYHAYPAWSPDGSTIACSITKSGNSEVYVIDTLGNELLQVTNSPSSSDISPTWSPTGDAIAFHSNRSGNVDIWMVGIECGPPEPGTGLIGHWSFDDGTATDNSPYGHNGTLFGSPQEVSGVCGNALQFDGVDDYIDLGNPSGLNPKNAMTLAAWYKPESFYGRGNQPIIDKGYYSHTYPYYQYHLGVSGDQGNMGSKFELDFSPGNQWSYAVTPAQFWTPGNWYHLAGTYDGSEVRLYVNGELISSAPATGSLKDYGSPVFIARHTNLTGDVYLPGTIDEIRMYSTALSAAEISELYEDCNQGSIPISLDIKPGSCPNPLNVTNFYVDNDGGGGQGGNRGRSGGRRSRAVVPVSINGSEDFDVTDIDPGTIRLAGVSPRRTSFEDVNTPAEGNSEECPCSTDGGDGFTDLTLKFDKRSLVDSLGEIYAGDVISLNLTGELYDGTPIEGSDCVVIVGGKPRPADDDPPEVDPAMPVMPATASLNVNYPNPFNPTTSIAFALPEASQVSLDIYNIKGQKVATLVDGFLEAGEHNVQWNASGVASGVYLYRITAGEFVQTRKMVLLK